MKKFLVMALMATLLFTGIGTTASAEDSCVHTYSKQLEETWRTVQPGYTHYYTTSSGQPAGCIVEKKEKVLKCQCLGCQEIFYIFTGVTQEFHQVAEYNNH